MGCADLGSSAGKSLKIGNLFSMVLNIPFKLNLSIKLSFKLRTMFHIYSASAHLYCMQAATALAPFRNHLLLKTVFITLARGGWYPGTQQQHIIPSSIKHANRYFHSHHGMRSRGIGAGKHHHHQHQHVTHAHVEEYPDGPHLVPGTSTSEEGEIRDIGVLIINLRSIFFF